MDGDGDGCGDFAVIRMSDIHLKNSSHKSEMMLIFHP